MPDIPITDIAHATADLKISDASPFALAKLSTLNFASLPVVGDFQRPVDQSTIEHASFGMRLGSPALLAREAFPTGVEGTVKGTLAIRKASSGGLFDDDGFSPELPIQDGSCWIGLDLELDITAKAGAAFQGFGVEVEGDSVAAVGTLLRLDSASGSLPKLAEALKAALEHYSIPRTVEEIRKQPLGTAHTAEVGGTVTFSGSYSVPISANALASASLPPFNYKIAVNPEAILEIGGSLALSGDFVVRTYKTSETQLTLGLYKKKGTTIEVEFTALAGVEANAGASGKDLVSRVLNGIFRKIDSSAAGFTGDQAEALDDALHACIDNSFATSINGSCAASKTDESAVVYSIDLSAGDQAATDKAITSALHGNWTLLENLQNAHPVRNVVRDVRTKSHKIVINLLGFYNAISVSEYVKSCQVLRDPDGQVVLVDKTKANQLRAAGAPKMADAEQLRAALGEGFLTTATYAAAAGGKLALTNFTVQQTYARYAAKMPADEVRRQVRLGRALKLIGNGGWDAKVAGTGTFAHARTMVAASYDAPGTLRLFFANPGARTGFTRAQLEKTGRDSKIALLDPSETNAGARIRVLRDDSLWAAMDESGNPATFKTIDGLRGLNTTELGAVTTDWVDIRWWANAMLKVAPQLSQVLHAIELSTAPDPTTDAAFMKQRKALEDILSDVGKNTRSAFGDGWGLLVMFNLSSGAAALEMDLGWNGTLEHYVSGTKVATALGGS